MCRSPIQNFVEISSVAKDTVERMNERTNKKAYVPLEVLYFMQTSCTEVTAQPDTMYSLTRV
jgi:hypothetical protein